MRFFRDGDLRRINGGTGEINRLYYGGGLLGGGMDCSGCRGEGPVREWYVWYGWLEGVVDCSLVVA